jgi:hypothetical protein
MSQQRATGHGSGHDLSGVEQRRREYLEQILRKAPDRRRVSEQLVGLT